MPTTNYGVRQLVPQEFLDLVDVTDIQSKLEREAELVCDKQLTAKGYVVDGEHKVSWHQLTDLEARIINRHHGCNACQAGDWSLFVRVPIRPKGGS